MKSAVMIAATGSGCGKTTITCALLSAMKHRKLNIRAFKCGPDYIDPMFHRSVIGVESENLDLFFSDDNQVRELFYCGNDSDISIVEGVMGLYDGIRPSSNEGSSYDLACKLDIPVVLVVDAAGMGRSILAVIKGFLEMDDEKRIKGVILNCISPAYFDSIKNVIENELDVTVLGYYPKQTGGTFKSRYLGLMMPSEIEDIRTSLDKSAKIIEDTVSLDSMIEFGKRNADLQALSEKKRYSVNNGEKIRIAVARDEAFCFYYEENFRILESFGAQLVEFSPLNDEKLPPDVCGLILGGGYPELYAKRLSDNVSMRESVQYALAGGMPSLAECGGFMYLHSAIEADGMEYPMIGAIEGVCVKKDSLIRFGYMTIEEKQGNFMSDGNKKIRGHEFHYYESTDNGADAVSVKPNSEKCWDSAHIGNNNWWGFAHLYYLSNPNFADAFVEKCRSFSKYTEQ